MSGIVFEFVVKLVLICSAFQCAIGESSLANTSREIKNISAKLQEVLAFQQRFLENAATRQIGGNESITLPQSCSEAFDAARGSGIYHIHRSQSSLKPFAVYCLEDQQDVRPWTVVQRRVDNTTDFYRGWREYKRGFGELTGNFWIGLDKLHALTGDPQDPQELWIELRDTATADARYSRFVVGGEFEQYKLKDVGLFTGNAGDSLTYHVGMNFTTHDFRDEMHRNNNCAETYRGAWWYRTCHYANLNGLYGVNSTLGVTWHTYRMAYTQLSYAQMAIRPVQRR